MPGVPKSDRCKYCKQRKIKCDERWPQCGNCRRSNRPCSGPPTERKFVQATFSSLEAAESDGRQPSLSVGTTAQATGKLVGVKARTTPSGTGMFHQLRLERETSPTYLSLASSAVPTTTAGRAAKRLVSTLVAPSDECYGLSLSRRTLALLPARIDGSRALQHAVECLVTSHTNLRRQPAYGNSDGDLLDLKTYGRALRSIQAALGDPGQMFDTSTLAAISILQRVETSYGGLHTGKRAHSEGIYSLMDKRGPDKLHDELELNLALDNLGQIMTWSILARKQHIYALPEWSAAIIAALEFGAVTSSVLVASYHMCLQCTQWPLLVNALDTILQQQRQGPLQPAAREATARLVDDASALNASMLDAIRAAGAGGGGGPSLVERRPEEDEEDGSWPFGTAQYDFPDLTTAQCHCYQMMVLIAFNRILAAALGVLGGGGAAGSAPPPLEEQNRELSRRIWLVLPYARRLKPLGCAFLVTPLVISFESAAAAAERRYIMEALRDLEGYKAGAAGRGREWTEENILRVCMVMTGRLPLDRANDLGIELRSEGARM